MLSKADWRWSILYSLCLVYRLGVPLERRATPSDRKLSDGGGRRSLCGRGRTPVEGVVKGSVAGRLARQAAHAVTAGAVRCSAWLGAFMVVLSSR